MKKRVVYWSLMLLLVPSCQQQEEKTPAKEEKPFLPEWKKPKRLAYRLAHTAEWLQDSTLTDREKELVYAVNRTDRSNFKHLDSVLLPLDLSGDLVSYFPFPPEVPALNDVAKVVFFSYPTQTFAAYEHGVLVYTGPTNMGRAKDPTPTGLFFTNWKAKKTISTVNDEWELKWNFNILNNQGIGWHQYTMPGYPASHSCLRLTEQDAKYLYQWADQWVLANKTTVQVKGTPVIVFGTYDFSAPKPWLKLPEDPHALDISEEELESVAEPFLDRIFAEQENREQYESARNPKAALE